MGHLYHGYVSHNQRVNHTLTRHEALGAVDGVQHLAKTIGSLQEKDQNWITL